MKHLCGVQLCVRLSHLSMYTPAGLDHPFIQQLEAACARAGITVAKAEQRAGLRRGMTRTWVAKRQTPLPRSVQALIDVLDAPELAGELPSWADEVERRWVWLECIGYNDHHLQARGTRLSETDARQASREQEVPHLRRRRPTWLSVSQLPRRQRAHRPAGEGDPQNDPCEDGPRR